MINRGETVPIHTAQESERQLAVLETEGLRWLDFGDGGVQSAIDPRDAGKLVLPLNQAMLTGLLFLPTPQRVLLLGTGGGAIARYLHHRKPTCQGDAVEQSATVADIARQHFDFPGQETGWSLHIAEAQDYVATAHKQYDLIVLDIADGQHSPPWVSKASFLQQCRQRLTASGALVLNLIPHNAEDFVRMLTPIREAFPLCTACLSVPEQHNVLVFAFRESPDCKNIESRIPTLSAQWDLPFAELLQRLRRDNPTGSGIF